MEKSRIHFGTLPLNVCMRLVGSEIGFRLEKTDVIVESVGVEDDIYFRGDGEYELIHAHIVQEPSDWVLFWDPETALISESMTLEEYNDELERRLYEGEKRHEKEALLSTRLEDIDITVRTLNICKLNSIETLGDLTKLTRADFLRMRSAGGKKAITELDDLLEKHGLKWKE